MTKRLAFLSLLPGLLAAQTSIFTGDGNWLDVARWDTGAVVPDNQTAVVNGNAIVDQNTGASNTDNPGRVEIGSGEGAVGMITVTGGTLSGAHGGNSGVFVGVSGGSGTLVVEEGATYRSQGGGMEVAIGDFSGGTGSISVAGVLQIYKFLNINNGILEMLPTGQSNLFNSNDQSNIQAAGTLSFVIDGPNVGSLERSNTIGLNMTIDPASNLAVTLGGDFALNDSWTLMSYTTLNGQFSQGDSFTNQQGYTFSINYGSGANDVMTLTLTSDSERPRIDALTSSPAAISAGGSSTIGWTASNFDSLTLDPGGVDVTALSESVVMPTMTTTYTLTAQKGGVKVTREVSVVVDELPEINSFSASDLLIAPGDATTLAWDVSGADTVSISPQPGVVSAVATEEVSPTVTTTYTLTATNGTGSVDSSVEVVVDALSAAIIHCWDLSLPNQTSGAILDSVGGKNFDITGGNLLTGVTSANTSLTAAITRINQAAVTGGDMGLGFPSQDTTFEIWIRSGELDENPQVIFETGSPLEGSAILMTSSAIRFLHATGGANTIDMEAAISLISPSDFVQIVVTLDSGSGDANLSVKGASGGAVSTTSNGTIGAPNGRASLFTWSGFGGGVDAALGGTGGTAPIGTTTFKGSIGSFKIYDRALDSGEIDETFLLIADSIVDSDMDDDMLADFWEIMFFGDLTAKANENGDGDLLSNLQEFLAGTNPTLADSDDDGLDDHIEISFDEPTDPNNRDTDGDGLTDGEEVNGDPSSNPLLADSDGDLFGDNFEKCAGSNPNDAGSLPPEDGVGTPFANLGTLGTGASFDTLFGASDFTDASFRVVVDFEEKTEGERELLFETGGATVGISLVYEAGNQIVFRAAGSGGLELATATYTLTAGEINAGDLVVVVTYDVMDDEGNSAIAMYVNGALVASDAAPLGGDWTGANGSAFGVGGSQFAGDGANGNLAGLDFTSGSINLQKGLTYYADTLFEGGNGSGLQITNISHNGSAVVISFQSLPGRTYRLERSFDLVTFAEIEDGIASAGATTTAPSIQASEPGAFYRVVEE